MNPLKSPRRMTIPSVCSLLLLTVLAVLMGVGCVRRGMLPSSAPPVLPTPEAGTLIVDPNLPVGEISPLLLGANHGPWAVVTVDLLDAAANAGITFLRFPGGAFGDQFNLTYLQLDQFLDLCVRMGAEPSISVRLAGGSPEAAADMLHYVNHEQRRGVRYWSIGNEPDLYPDYDAEQFNQEWRVIAEAMLAVDPSILLLGPETSQYTGLPNEYERAHQFLESFLVSNGDLVDIVAVHRYPFPTGLGGATTTEAALLAESEQWNDLLQRLNTLVLTQTGEAKPLAVTEANSHWTPGIGGPATPDTLANAIWWSDVLGRMMMEGVQISAYFSLQSSDSVGGYGLLGRYQVRPTYYVYQLYQRFGTTLVHAASAVEDVSLYAAVEGTSLSIMVINRRYETTDVPLIILPGETYHCEERLLLDAEHLADSVPCIPFERNLSLPPLSATMILAAPEAR